MLERPDAVLALIPLLAVSGLAVRTLLAVPGIGSGLFTAPVAIAGYLAALALVFPGDREHYYGQERTGR